MRFTALLHLRVECAIINKLVRLLRELLEHNKSDGLGTSLIVSFAYLMLQSKTRLMKSQVHTYEPIYRKQMFNKTRSEELFLRLADC